MTALQQAKSTLAQNGIPGQAAFSQGFLRVRHKFTLRTEEDVTAYVRRIESAIRGLEIDNVFLTQSSYPFPSHIEIWFRLTGEASRQLGAPSTPNNAEAPLVSPVGRIYRVGKRKRVQEPDTGGVRQPMAMPQGTEALENMQSETAGQQAPEQQPVAQETPTATSNGTGQEGQAAPDVQAQSAGAAGRPPAQPLPAVVEGSEVDQLLKNKDLSDSEKARRLVQDHDYTIANAAKQLSITRGKPMRYQQVYQSLHGKEMRAVRDVKQAGGTEAEVEAAREKAKITPLGTSIKEPPAQQAGATGQQGSEPGPVGTNEGAPTPATPAVTPETGGEVTSEDTGEDPAAQPAQ